MSHAGLTGDRLAPAWAALTAEQRICWHFTAAKRPIALANGELFTENGWQYFVDVNAPLADVDATHILTDPPPEEPLPVAQPLVTAAWPLPAKLGAGGSARRPKVTLEWPSIGPTEADVIITQEYDKFLQSDGGPPLTQRISAVNANGTTWITTGTTGEYLTTGINTLDRPQSAKLSNKPSVRHVAAWQPGDGKTINLDGTTGYYATTDGENRFASIKGQTAARRPDLPLAIVNYLHRVSGQKLRATVPNPTGGSVTNISRPRHFP